MSSENEHTTAEQRFRLAFERLKENKPLVLKPGTPVSQNNVAKESGCDPSALRKSRFPSLVREIKAYVEITNQAAPSKRQERLKQRKTRANFDNRLAAVIAQRDTAQSQLLCAQRMIVDLTFELNTLKKSLPTISNFSREQQ